MTEKEILEIYDLIKKNIRNQSGCNGRLANELCEQHFLEQEDLIQDVITYFLEKERAGKIGEIENMQGFVSIFVHRYLINLGKKYTAQKVVPRSKLDEYKEYWEG